MNPKKYNISYTFFPEDVSTFVGCRKRERMVEANILKIVYFSNAHLSFSYWKNQKTYMLIINFTICIIIWC